jgi:hypothetical protein
MREGSKQLRRFGVAAVLLLAAFATARGQASMACGTATTLDDGWTIASPESVGLDSARLCAIAGDDDIGPLFSAAPGRRGARHDGELHSSFRS